MSGGHPALDFVNTVDSRRGRLGPDFLVSFADLATLAQRVGLISPADAGRLLHDAASHPGGTASFIRRARKLREAAYRLFIAETAAQDFDNRDVATVEAEAQKARLRQRLVFTDGLWAWSLPLNEPEDVLAVFAIAAADLLTGRELRRPVRECKGHNCGWLFLDHSKAGRRKWCSEASCGTRSRVERFRSKET
ncbi:putative RNA-binding Zn ribbon-like protein [Rhizobium sp. BK650]|nr:putative RNA-binding Zn ribbon-like protein [Rhizobium sp. BK650]